MNPFVLGIIIVCICLAIAIFIFTFIFHQPLYKFPIIGRFLGNFSPWRHTYVKDGIQLAMLIQEQII